MFTRSRETRETKARTDDTGHKPTVFQVAWIRPIAGLCGGLALLTIFWPDWIEALTGYDPDQHAGLVEWLMVIALLLNCPVLALAARAEWRDRGPRLSNLD